MLGGAVIRIFNSSYFFYLANPNAGLRFCRDPGVDPNAIRRPRIPPSRRGFPQGSRLEYSCNQGYDLSGERSLFCMVSGEWSASRPRCNTQSQNPGNSSEWPFFSFHYYCF